MDWLEDGLKRALAREQPAPGFADRVRRRSAGGSRLVPGLAAGASARRWLAVAASVVVLAAGGLGYRWRQGIQAKEQVLTAVRLTAGKLNRVQTQVKEAGQ